MTDVDAASPERCSFAGYFIYSSWPAKAGHPRLSCQQSKAVDARDKPAHGDLERCPRTERNRGAIDRAINLMRAPIVAHRSLTTDGGRSILAFGLRARPPSFDRGFKSSAEEYG
ncbi:MAG: hypothetical protein EXQ91_01125 [Alphaproteobacteria bacterium]|nr:hypothetical protein [Alphaproteobacteria bacterium]